MKLSYLKAQLSLCPHVDDKERASFRFSNDPRCGIWLLKNIVARANRSDPQLVKPIVSNNNSEYDMEFTNEGLAAIRDVINRHFIPLLDKEPFKDIAEALDENARILLSNSENTLTTSRLTFFSQEPPKKSTTINAVPNDSFKEVSIILESLIKLDLFKEKKELRENTEFELDVYDHLSSISSKRDRQTIRKLLTGNLSELISKEEIEARISKLEEYPRKTADARSLARVCFDLGYFDLTEKALRKFNFGGGLDTYGRVDQEKVANSAKLSQLANYFPRKFLELCDSKTNLGNCITTVLKNECFMRDFEKQLDKDGLSFYKEKLIPNGLVNEAPMQNMTL